MTLSPGINVTVSQISSMKTHEGVEAKERSNENEYDGELLETFSSDRFDLSSK